MSQLLNSVRESLRLQRYAMATEKAYIYWIKRYIYFYNKQHPNLLNDEHIKYFLTYLADQENVAANTQNQALCALVYLYRHVLQIELADFSGFGFSKRAQRIPVVFTHHEAMSVITQLSGDAHLATLLMYGAGLRVSEVINLRVKDVEFEQRRLIVKQSHQQMDTHRIEL